MSTKKLFAQRKLVPNSVDVVRETNTRLDVLKVGRMPTGTSMVTRSYQGSGPVSRGIHEVWEIDTH